MRLDRVMVERGLSATRSQAREAILRGVVRVAGNVATKPGQNVPGDAAVMSEAAPYVGRGAHKLAHALDHFALDPHDAMALDVGASTGGFTEVLLRGGVRHVVALDVARDQLAPSLAVDHRVSVLDGVNARHLEALPYPPDFVVADVSFISLTLVLPPVLALAAPCATLVALVKPQFEVGRALVGKGGVVRDGDAARAAVDRVATAIERAGLSILGTTPSPIAGGDGNREWLIAARR